MLFLVGRAKKRGVPLRPPKKKTQNQAQPGPFTEPPKAKELEHLQ